MLYPPLEQAVCNYLHYGYLPPEEFPCFLSDLEKYPTLRPTVENTKALFQKVFNEAIEESVGKGYCIIPLSGGWDSRLLLGYALKTLPTRQIKTYTFGARGQLDFDIGKRLARKANVEHVAFDLNDISLTWGALKKSVAQNPWTHTFDSFYNKYCYEKMSSGADILLSGFMGDPLTGGHKYKKDGPLVKKIFAHSQAVSIHKMPLLNDYIPEKALPDILPETLFSDHQILDLGVRQSRCIAPIISYKKQWDSWDTSLGKIVGSNAEIISPFIHPKWIHYWLNVPDSQKKERKLYLEFLRETFPKLANLPSKDFYGAKTGSGMSMIIREKRYYAKMLLNRQYPNVFAQPKEMLNYLNFNRAFRVREDYRNLLEKAFLLLKEHSLADSLDLEKTKVNHTNYRQQHANIFLVFIGLALNLEIEKNRKSNIK